jgi:hypothetical protein
MISRIIQTSVYVIRLSFASADNIDLAVWIILDIMLNLIQ